MSIYLKAVGSVLLAVILCIALSKQGRELSLLLSIAVCCMVGVAAFSLLGPVIDFAERLQTRANLNTEMWSILLKTVGIGLLTQITVLICSDAGNATLGKILQITASIVILRLSLPLLEELMNLVNDILDNI